MKNSLVILFILCLTLSTASNLYAQKAGTSPKPGPPPLPLRDVNGMVKDIKSEPLAGAVVVLTSAKDTLKTIVGANGSFTFTNVKLASFFITVSGVGIETKTIKYLNNDLAKKLVLEPIVPKEQVNMLQQVTIKGAPSIIYKTDTVEYRAGDYKVREYDNVDELLKKMEGMEVGKDGSLLYQGQQILKAKLNGKLFSGGNVAQIIQNLPAEIIEKAQIIDDYGDLAARTGIKTGTPEKILNLTTKASRFVGTTGSIIAQAGTNNRYTGNFNLTRLNANRQIAILGNINNTVTGGSGGIGGVTRSGNPGMSFSDQFGKTRVTANYNGGFTNNTSLNKSFGETYSYGQNAFIKNTSSFTRESSSESRSRNHQMMIDLDYNFNKFNYLKLLPTFNYSTSNSLGNSLSDNLNNFVSGFEHPVIKSSSNNLSESKNYGINVIYQHIFKKSRRNISLQLGYNKANTNTNGERYSDYTFFADSTQNVLLRDSLAHLLTQRSNINTSYNATITYVEPITKISQFEFTGRFNRSAYDTRATSDTVLANGQLLELSRLNNIFNYSYTETRLTLNYNYNGKKINFSVGGSLAPGVLGGTKINNANNQSVSSSISNVRFIPTMRFSYIWSTTSRMSINYSGNSSTPSFDQIQPFTDRTDPNNIITGNPNLRPAFNHSLGLNYNNFIASKKITIGVNINASLFEDKVVNNVIQHPQLISTNPDRYRTIYETTFANLNGAKTLNANYSFNKQLANKKFSIALNGQMNYNYNVAMSNDVLYHSTSWRFTQRLGPKFNPNDNIEFNPILGYDLSRTFTSLPGANTTYLRTTSMALDGRVFFLKTWRTTYSASKNFVTGLGNLNTNPLVINAGVEKQLLKRKNLTLTLNAYDLLHQNNFIQQNVSPQGVTNTLANSLTRYFIFGVRFNFQKWNGVPQRGGRVLQRMGDGSFIY